MTDPTYAAAAPKSGAATGVVSTGPETAVTGSAGASPTTSTEDAAKKTADQVKTDTNKKVTESGNVPNPFAQEKKKMTQGEFMETATPSKEVVILVKDQDLLAEAVRRYDKRTQLMKGSATEFKPSNRDEAVTRLRKEIDDVRGKKEGNKELFYEASEVSLALSVVEDMMIQEAAAIAYKLTQNGAQEGSLTLPKDLLVRKDLWGRASDAITGPLEAIGVKIIGLTGNEIRFQADPNSTAWITNRTQYGDFLSEKVTDQERAKRLVDAQKLRYTVYENIGLDLKRVDQLSMLSLGPEDFDPDAGPQARNSIVFHNQTIDHLRNILRQKYPGQSYLDLDPSARTQLLLDARQLAAKEMVIGVGKSILQEQDNGLKKNVQVADLDAKAEKLGEIHQYSPAEIALIQKQVEKAQQQTVKAAEMSDLYIKLIGSDTEPESITNADLTHKEKESALTELRNMDGAFILSVESRPEKLVDEIQRLAREIKDKEGQRAATGISAADYDRISREIQQFEKDKVSAERLQTLYDQKKAAIVKAENEVNEAKRVLDRRNTRKTEIEDFVKNALKEGTFDIGLLDKYIMRKDQDHTYLQRVLEQARKNEPIEENAPELKAMNKLSDVIKNDHNRIIEAIVSGKVRLSDLGDPENGYDRILELLWHSNKESVQSIPKDLQEQMLSRFELAVQTAEHYQIELRTNPDFIRINNIRTSIRNQQAHLEQLRASGAPQADIDTAQHAIDVNISVYQDSTSQAAARNLLEQLLPQIRTNGRWEAGQLMQQILESRLNDALKDHLLDPSNYPGVRPVERTPSPTGPEPAGIEIPTFKDLAPGTIEIRDSQSIATIMKRLGIEQLPPRNYRDALLYKQEFNGIEMEAAFLTSDEATRGLVFVERLVANEDLYRLLPDTITDALDQGWSLKTIEYFYSTADGRKDRKNITNETITTATDFSNYQELTDHIDLYLPEANNAIKESGYNLITSRNLADRLDLFSGFTPVRIILHGVNYRIGLDNTGELMVSATALPAAQRIEDFLNTAPAVITNDDKERIRTRVGLRALDTLRQNI